MCHCIFFRINPHVDVHDKLYHAFHYRATPKSKICLNFNFQGGGGVLNQIPEQGVVRNLSTNFALPLSGSLCITDSLAHTTYVETNQQNKHTPVLAWDWHSHSNTLFQDCGKDSEIQRLNSMLVSFCPFNMDL